MGKKKPPYPPELRSEAVRLARSSGEFFCHQIPFHLVRVTTPRSSKRPSSTGRAGQTTQVRRYSFTSPAARRSS